MLKVFVSRIFRSYILFLLLFINNDKSSENNHTCILRYRPHLLREITLVEIEWPVMLVTFFGGEGGGKNLNMRVHIKVLFA